MWVRCFSCRVWGALLLGLWLIPCGMTMAQDAAAGKTPPPGGTGAEFAERLRAMEEANRQLSERLERSTREHDEQIRRLLERLGEPSNRAANNAANGSESAPTEQGTGTATEGIQQTAGTMGSPLPDYSEGLFAPYNLPAGFVDQNTTSPRLSSLNAFFGPGFQLRSKDDEYRLQIHIQSQVESRVWGRDDQDPVNNGIFLPRQRIFFNGNVTKSIEYVFSINRGFGDLNLLDSFINFHIDDRLMLRFGRFWTPLGYDQFAFPNLWLLTPERSLFTANLSLNRQVGAMAWGYLFKDRLDYAAGIFNGPRNSFEDFNDAKDFVGYVNARPFQEWDYVPYARFLNIGTSVAYGHQNQPTVPLAMRIGSGASNAEPNTTASVPFLTFAPDVIERGDRLLGSVHMAYFYKSLSLMGEWQYGYKNYASRQQPTPVQVPVNGFYVAAGYFLTGEEVQRRAIVRPLRPFIPRNKGDSVGPGAWELVGRVSHLNFGNEVFNAGFSDPKLWANAATTTELGANWYMNDFVKVYMFWLHGDFNRPVQYRPGGLQKGTDLFWLRAQLYF